MLRQRGLGVVFVAAMTAAITFLTGGGGTAVGSGPLYWLEQGGAAVPVSTVATAQTVAQYYASIRFGTVVPEEEKSVVLLHEDTSSGDVSLVFIHEAVGGTPSNANDGTTRVTVTGVPAGASWYVQDDPYSPPYDWYDVSGDVAAAYWHWYECCTDGGAISGLSGDIHIEVEYSDYDDPTWGSLDGIVFGDGDGERISLDLGQPFTISTSVPNKAAILKGTGVPGKGIDKAPGLQKEFNPNSKAAANAGKKK